MHFFHLTMHSGYYTFTTMMKLHSWMKHCEYTLYTLNTGCKMQQTYLNVIILQSHKFHWAVSRSQDANGMLTVLVFCCAVKASNRSFREFQVNFRKIKFRINLYQKRVSILQCINELINESQTTCNWINQSHIHVSTSLRILSNTQ